MTIGIDAEPNEPLPSGVLPLVLRAEDRMTLVRLAAERPDVRWDRLFSMKESVSTAWLPLTRRWLGFEQALVTFEPGTGTFSAHLRDVASVGGLTGFGGRWLVRDGLALTAITGVSKGASGRSLLIMHPDDVPSPRRSVKSTSGKATAPREATDNPDNGDRRRDLSASLPRPTALSRTDPENRGEASKASAAEALSYEEAARPRALGRRAR